MHSGSVQPAGKQSLETTLAAPRSKYLVAEMRKVVRPRLPSQIFPLVHIPRKWPGRRAQSFHFPTAPKAPGEPARKDLSQRELGDHRLGARPCGHFGRRVK